MCKSFRAPPFTLLIVPYNSVYYNYIIIMQWLVGLGIKAKREFVLAKKCTVARGLYSCNLTAAVQHNPQDSGFFSGLRVLVSLGPWSSGPGPVFIVFLEQMSL